MDTSTHRVSEDINKEMTVSDKYFLSPDRMTDKNQFEVIRCNQSKNYIKREKAKLRPKTTKKRMQPERLLKINYINNKPLACLDCMLLLVVFLIT